MAGGFGALAAAVGKSVGQQVAAPSMGSVIPQQAAWPSAMGHYVGQMVSAPAHFAGAAVGDALAQAAPPAPPGPSAPQAVQVASEPFARLAQVIAALPAADQKVIGNILSLARSVGSVANGTLATGRLGLDLVPEEYDTPLPPEGGHLALPSNPFDAPRPKPPPPPIELQFGPQGGTLPPNGPDRLGPHPGTGLGQHLPSFVRPIPRSWTVPRAIIPAAHPNNQNTGKFGRPGYLKYD